jgi:hypothetical protein
VGEAPLAVGEASLETLGEASLEALEALEALGVAEAAVGEADGVGEDVDGGV